MTVKTIFCDVCKEEGALTSHFYVDRAMDGAGSMSDDLEPMDLCIKCSWAAYKLAEKHLSFDKVRAIVAELRSRGDRKRKRERGEI